jgi:hypothetical protein
MGWPIDPTGGNANRYAQELARRNRAQAGKYLKEGVKQTARTIRGNPRVVQQVGKVALQQGVRTAGLSVGESAGAVIVAEGGAGGGGAATVFLGLTAGELLIAAAVVIFIAYLCYSWSQMDPKLRGYGSTFDGSQVQQEMVAMGEEGPVGGLQRVLGRRGCPQWMKGLAAEA